MNAFVVMAVMDGDRWPVAVAATLREAVTACEYTLPHRWDLTIRDAFGERYPCYDHLVIVEYRDGFACCVHSLPVGFIN